MIAYGEKDIFSLDAECVVNTVNCQVHKLYDRKEKYPSKFPTAQKGLAAAFETRFPGTQEALINACQKGQMRPGSVQMIRTNSKTGQRDQDGDVITAHVATKDYWGDPSKIEWVRLGLVKLAHLTLQRGIKSIAIPPMGAGLGGLPWEQVQKEIHEIFSPLAENGVTIFALREDALGLEGTIAQPFYYAGIGARDLWGKKEKIPSPVRNEDGSWTAHSEAQKRIVELGMILAARGGILRSGAAVGSDAAFEFGCDLHFGKKEIYLPNEGFEGRKGSEDHVFCTLTEKHTEIASRYHPRWGRLGDWEKNAMARNASQCLGEQLDTPSNVIVCYTPNGKEKGGTGQSMRMGAGMGIPVVNINDPTWRHVPVDELAEAITRIARKESTLEAEIQAAASLAPGQLGLAL